MKACSSPRTSCDLQGGGESRSGKKIPRRKACRFDSGLGHQFESRPCICKVGFFICGSHVAYLARQSLDIFVALHTCAAGSKFVLPSRYAIHRCMSHATLNRITQLIASRAKEAGLPLAPFTVHDLRRTGSTLLNEVGFNGDWIEKCLAHEDGRSSRSVYNKAEYAEQRRHMLQEWADMVDAWIDGRTHVPKLMPDNLAVPVLSATV